jgi:hypothetical protein
MLKRIDDHLRRTKRNDQAVAMMAITIPMATHPVAIGVIISNHPYRS